MQKIIGSIKDAPRARGVNDDDFCDRLSSRYTVVILVTFALFVMASHYIKQPMNCWTPVHFKKYHAKFATNYCWVKNTYYLPWDKDFHAEWGKEEDRHMITYYQWIPFILIAQAFLFYLPNLLWHGLNSRAGVDADSILRSAETLSATKLTESRTRTLKMLTNQIDRFLCNQNQEKQFSCDMRSIVSNTCCRLCGRRLGNYLLLLFLFSKVCYIGNAIGQLFLLNVILSTKYNTFGFDYVKDLLNNDVQAEDGYAAFPRVTLCDFEIRGQDMNNVQRYTIQCVLPMNMYNEKIYIFVWYWMVFVACASSVNLLLWLLRAIIKKDRTQFIKNHLSLGNVTYSDKHVSEFCGDYLKQDGCLLLRLIAHNSDHITTTEITCSLFDLHNERNCSKSDDNGETGLISEKERI